MKEIEKKTEQLTDNSSVGETVGISRRTFLTASAFLGIVAGSPGSASIQRQQWRKKVLES